ncbi:MAG: DUF2110 family protein [Candidatus Bathyarchaeota archaeon]|nr:DUF2110 family protein [Candidatus Bathyarchaeota archaeon]MDH5494780.1 DUF2110 family protein [Candidatus Bathyarchaeota archaeon]
MCEVVLLQKIYGESSLDELKEVLKGLCEGLRVELTGLSVVENGWVKVEISGEDEKVAVRFLERELGLAPITIRSVKRFSVLRGKVVFSGWSRMKISVDVGVFSPKPIYVFVPLRCLQGQLVDGRKFALERVAELFGLADGFPLEVRVVKAGADGFEAELTENQLELYSRWIDSRVDRLVVLGALGERVREAVRRARLKRDVLGVESLDFLEHVVVCNLGTDARGLVPKLGRRLFKARFVRFSPFRVLEFVGGCW